MGTTFALLVPELVVPVETALRSEGFAEQARSIASAVVERWTYDPSAKAGYIYLVQRTPVHHGETPAAETVASELGFNVDLRANGEVLGVELLAHETVFNRLSPVRGS